jgi:hypothetical protein
MFGTIEAKTVAGLAGGGAGSVVANFLLWTLGVMFWHAPSTAAQAETAIASVPAPVAALIGVVITAGSAGLAAYLAPHTMRPDLALNDPVKP